ncbi:MAG: FliI/YscN family ATPase [Myxococcaceae bacterium]
MSALDVARAVHPFRVTGRVELVRGLLLEATLPGARIAEVVTLRAAGVQVLAEVVGFSGTRAQLLPLGSAAGLEEGTAAECRGESLTVEVGEALVGRVLDGLGQPLDGRPLPAGLVRWPVDRPCPAPFRRARVDAPLTLGVRAIDGLCTVGRGQRLGLFAGAGVGKSTLLGQMARQTRADVTVVALVGERGRELREFVEDALGPEGLRRSVVVCATSDAPALVRLRAGFVATAIAEWFREQGGDVLFLLDSITRLARAQREVGLAAGEPPARQGYPPSVFSMLPRLLERTGNSERGSCTALYTCLVAGDDLEDPIADEVRGILDGHVVLDRRIAERGRWPAVDVLASLSRVMPQVTSGEHRRLAARFRELAAAYEQRRDLILLGAYTPGTDALTDEAIARQTQLEAFLAQERDEPPGAVLDRLREAVEG